jgi:hypothetical protein
VAAHGSQGSTSNTQAGLGQQVAQRPWVMLGAAVAAGYLAGSLGGRSGGAAQPGAGSPGWSYTAAATSAYDMPAFTPSHTPAQTSTRFQQYRPPERESGRSRQQAAQGGHGVLAPIQDQVDEIAASAVSTIKTMIRDLVRDYTPEAQARRRSRLTDQPWPNLESGRGYAETYHPAGTQGSTP